MHTNAWVLRSGRGESVWEREEEEKEEKEEEEEEEEEKAGL